MKKRLINKISLIQPIIKVGKALRIQKSPTGIQCISAYLKQHKFNTRMFHEEESEKLYKDIISYSPDMVGLSAFTVNFPAALRIAGNIKKYLPDVPIVLGGWHASGVAESYLRRYEEWSLREILNQESPFDFIVIGEGEEPIVKLINTLNESSPNIENALKNIDGIGYLSKNNHIVVNRGGRINDLNELPDPDWEGLDINKYRDQRNTSMIDLSVHVQRGCRFSCTFCQTPSLYQNSVKRMSPERVVSYLEYLISKFQPSAITFTDEDFMSNPTWIKEVCALMIERGVNKNIAYGSFGSLNDIIKFEKHGALELLSKAGWKNYFVGIDSLEPDTLKKYDRPISMLEKENIPAYLEKIQNAINISRKRNLLLFGDFIIGYFEESPQQLEVGFDNILKLRNMLYTYLPIFTPFPGTPLWEIAVKKDKLIKRDGKIDWSLFDCSHQVCELPYNAVKLRDTFEKKYFTSQNYFTDMITHIKNEPDYLNDWYLPLFYKLKNDHKTTLAFNRIIQGLEKLNDYKNNKVTAECISHF